MKKITISLLVGALFLAGYYFYFQKSKTSLGNEKIKIGAILPLTGNSASIGNWQKNGMSIAMDEIKSKYKNANISISFEDSKGQASDGLSVYSKLSAQDISGYVISLSSVSNAIIPELNKKSKPTFLIAVSLPNIAEKGSDIYRFNIGSEDEAAKMSEYLIKKNIKKISIVYLNDEFGVGAVTAFTNKYNAFNGRIVHKESYLPDQSDFKTLALNLINDDSDGIYVIGYVPSSVLLIKQLKELNNKKPIYGNMALTIPSYLKLGGRALWGSEFTSVDYAFINNKEKDDFVKRYKLKYGEYPSFFAAYAYEATIRLFDTLKKSDSNLAFKQNLLNKQFHGPVGDYKLLDSQNFVFNIVLVENDSSKIILIK
jgi:branched-chain amino acid transport system substrate-binding protein